MAAIDKFYCNCQKHSGKAESNYLTLYVEIVKTESSSIFTGVELVGLLEHSTVDPYRMHYLKRSGLV